MRPLAPRLHRSPRPGGAHARRQAAPGGGGARAAAGAVAEVLALQRAAGNRAVTELIAQRTAAPSPRSPLLAEIDDRLAPTVRAALRADEPRREFLLALYARLRPFWSHVPVGGITWIGDHAEMQFRPDDEAALRRDLVAAGFTSTYFAATGGDTWGLREPGVSAAGLHWRGGADGQVNVHIDLHPPSGTGLWHWLQDLKHRATTHTPDAVRRSVESLHVEIPVLAQQEVHGQLTVRLRALDAAGIDGPEVGASLELARAVLDGAAAIIWTRDVVSREQLAEAIALLAEADLELDRAAVLAGVRPGR
jgi:hypothetical protein